MKNKNKKWIKLELTRVKLNPEQAVLSCCDFVERAVVLTLGQQCLGVCGGSVWEDASS